MFQCRSALTFDKCTHKSAVERLAVAVKRRKNESTRKIRSQGFRDTCNGVFFFVTMVVYLPLWQIHRFCIITFTIFDHFAWTARKSNNYVPSEIILMQPMWNWVHIYFTENWEFFLNKQLIDLWPLERYYQGEMWR